MKLVTRRGQPYEYHDEETGQDFFSVTQIRTVMHNSYAGVSSEILEPARLRGQLLHTRFWKMLGARAGLCAMPPILHAYAGQCSAMDEWAETHQVTPITLEQKGVNRKLGYAGQTDTQCRYGVTRTITLADLKTGQPTLTDPAQLLAYNCMEGFKSAQLLDLYVKADGTYEERFVGLKERVAQWAPFLNALNLLRWRRGQGVR